MKHPRRLDSAFPPNDHWYLCILYGVVLQSCCWCIKEKYIRDVETETDQRACSCHCIIRRKTIVNMTQCKDIILLQFVQNADVSCEIPIKHDTEKFYLISWLDGDSSIVNVINNCLKPSLTKRLEKYSISPRMLSASMFTHSESWWRLVGVHDDYDRRRRTKHDELHFERRRCDSNRQVGRTATDSPDWRRVSDH